MTFERVCLRLGKIGTRMGVKAEIERARSERPTKRGARVVPVRRKTQADELRSNLSLGGLSVRPEDVLAAAKTVSILIAITAVPLIILVVSLLGTAYAIPSILGALGASAIARESLMSHPARLAARAASEVLGDSSETSNLMIMSLRHEHSVSRAITFASAGEGRFKREDTILVVGPSRNVLAVASALAGHDELRQVPMDDPILIYKRVLIQ